MHYIDPLPAAPEESDPASFPTLASAFVLALILFRIQANLQAADINDAATAAAASAASAVLSPGSSATSTTSLVTGTGTRTLTVQTGKNFVPGLFVILARTSDPTAVFMHGQITAYNSGTGSLTIASQVAVGSGTFADWTVGLSAPMNFVAATNAQIFAGASDAVALTPHNLFTSAEPVALAQSGGTVTLDLTAGLNFTLTPTANFTMPNPTTLRAGQAFAIAIKQGSSPYAGAFGTAFKFNGGTPTLTATASAVDLLAGICLADGTILCTLTKDFKA